MLTSLLCMWGQDRTGEAEMSVISVVCFFLVFLALGFEGATKKDPKSTGKICLFYILTPSVDFFIVS